MEVILLERVAKLGQMGEVVRVKDGFARNFLLPRGKALRATKDNRAKFDGDEGRPRGPQPRSQGRSREGRRARSTASNVVVAASGLGNRPALRLGVEPRPHRVCSKPTASASTATQILLDPPIKTIGQHKIAIAVHPEVEVGVTVTVARNAEEAERIARGEDVTVRREEER